MSYSVYFLIIFRILLIQKAKGYNYILPFQSININLNESIINQDYLSKIYSSKLYTNFIIGSNKEKIEALINMSQIGFFIYENAYNYNASSSFNQIHDIQSFYKKNYEKGYLANDSLCLIPYSSTPDLNNINIKECKNFDKVNFALLKSEQHNMKINLYEKYGIIGLQQNDDRDGYLLPLFIKSLKNTDMINSHAFSFNFINNTKAGVNEGYIILGDEEFDEDHGKLEKAKSHPKNGQLFWNLVFKNIIIGKKNSYDTSYDNHLRQFEVKIAQIIADLPYILGVKEYNQYIRSYFFQDLLMKDICIYKNVLIDEDYGTYVCDSKSDLFINKFNNEFPKLYFEHYDLKKIFILDQYDLFAYNNINKSDTNIYFLIFFPNKNEPYSNPEFPGRAPIIRWKLGIPFLKKYKLSFISDNGLILYYEKVKANNNDTFDKNDIYFNNKSNIKFIIIIALLSFIFVVFIFILGIVFYKYIIKIQKRKKKANELEDDYEYIINPNTLDNKKASLNNYEVPN